MYSQLNEEEFILDATAHIERGRFLDIGAYHSKTFSNTRALFERGWSGVMIDCAPRALVSLLEDYGAEERITIVNAAVALERVIHDDVPFYYEDPSVVLAAPEPPIE